LKSKDLVAGRNPVREALRGGRPLNKLFLAKGITGEVIKEIRQMAREKHVPIQQVERIYLDKLLPWTVHQGVIAFAAEKEYVSVDEILAVVSGDPFLILLSEVVDPRNLGAIMRTAEAVGVHGIIIPARRSASLTPAVFKAAAGAAEYLPVARVTNMAQTIRRLQQKNIWIVGAESSAQEIFWDVQLNGPLALVIGSEGKGLGPRLRKNCDLLVRLPMAGHITSLNTSVAAAVLAYEVFRQRRRAAHERMPDC
jgi:23S rRNA (guanosine2251-2'-O)-methyltransferase